MPPVITSKEHATLLAARAAGTSDVEVSLDLGRTTTTVRVTADAWLHGDDRYPFLDVCKDGTVYYWTGSEFLPVACYEGALVKLVPTPWGPPTFQLDGVKMLPTAHICPYEDAGRKVELIKPANKVILDTCGGLGYFAAWCVQGGARQVLSYEINPAVVWLRQLNPWSPQPGPTLRLVVGSVTDHVATLGDGAVDAILHDPPRFALAGELYAQSFYDHLARVLKRRGALFHYTGTPNRLTSGRNVPNEVAKRLKLAGFTATIVGDGLLAQKR